MIKLRRSDERGHFDHGWLDTRHTFSFAGYHDPSQMGFRSLRVINEDRVGPGEGFGTHPHQDMEIITYVDKGRLRHRDSTGTGSVIEAGQVQRMTAGSGVAHSEFNDSDTDPVHLIQIWIVPEERGLEPSYQQAPLPEGQGLRLVAGPEGRGAPLDLHQDAELLVADLDAGEEVEYPITRGRGLWLQVVDGSVSLDGLHLEAGDGAAVEDEPRVKIRAEDEAEVLLFDLG